MPKNSLEARYIKLGETVFVLSIITAVFAFVILGLSAIIFSEERSSYVIWMIVIPVGILLPALITRKTMEIIAHMSRTLKEIKEELQKDNTALSSSEAV